MVLNSFICQIIIYSEFFQESAPTIIELLSENNNLYDTYLKLIDNDSQLEIRPINIDNNMYMVQRTSKGYTLLGFFTDTPHGDEDYSYKLSFFGRSYQILHLCGTQTDEFYKYDTTVCVKTSMVDFTTKHVKSTFIQPNTANILARCV